MKRIAILSDTHGVLRESVINELAAADCIIHAGDINTRNIAASIREYGETYAVRGNNDKDCAEALPQSLAVTIENVRFFIVHNRKDIPKDLTGVDVAVYGHSHKYCAEVFDGVLFLNPGSCGKRRFDLDLTMCRMTVNAGDYQYERVLIPRDFPI
jgi:putative phosphoesterase